MPANDSTSFDSLDRESLQAIGRELEQHFPRTREETELVLMEISPHRLHAYWHITPWELDAVLASVKQLQTRLVIRFHDLSDVAVAQARHPWFDLELTETSGSQYVELWQDAKRYGAELGLRTADGQLLDLARSNTVELPRAQQSPAPGSRSLTLTPLEERLYQAPIDINQEDPGVVRQARLWRENPHQPLDLTLLDSGTTLFPEFPDLLRDPLQARRLLLRTYPRIQAIGIGLPASDIAPEQPPAAAAQPGQPDTSSPLSPIRELDWLSGAPVGRGDAAASPLPPWPDELPHQRAPSEPTGQDRAAAGSFPGTSPRPVSSFELGLQEDEELHMELHIRGRSRPDSHYVLFGQALPTDAQGRFSLTRTLPQEMLQLVAQLLAASRED